jgi:AcrR family transcriptional regulator
MEAATGTPRQLSGVKAQRIVDAMRRSVARRGSAGSTFDHVAREAGVSRGLLHYYFGSKERLLVEVVRRDCELRIGLLDAQLAAATTVDEFIDRLVHSLEDIVREDPDEVAVVFETFSLSRRNDEIAAELGELLLTMRSNVADLLDAKQREGVLHLRADPIAVAEVMFSLADGLALRMLTEPGRDFSATLAAGVACVRALLDDRG